MLDPRLPQTPLDRPVALAVLRAYLVTYCRDKTGREAPIRSKLLALDALALFEQEGR